VNKSAFFKKAFGLKVVFVAVVEEDISLPEHEVETYEMPENETEGDIVMESENDPVKLGL